MPATPVLTVDHLNKSFGEVPAVADVSLSVSAGRVTALLGRNGAGKTTTVECCIGLTRGWGGDVSLWDGAPGSRAAAARTGTMLQDGGLPRGVTARTALAHIGSLYDAPLPVAALLERLDLGAAARRRTESLSGGEARKLAFAAAVIGQPDLLLLDEPTASLDPHARQALWEWIRELKDGGTAVLLATHDMAEAAALADDVVIVDAGRTAAAGTLAAVAKRGGGNLEAAFFAVTARSTGSAA